MLALRRRHALGAPDLAVPSLPFQARLLRGRALTGPRNVEVSVHPSVLRGFGSAAQSYEQARPDYPVGAVSWLAERLGISSERTVVDLAAGTGKLTRLLVATGATVVAVEPVDAMRAQLERAVPEAQALAGYAERIPLADSSVDAVTVAQAFHWFASREALDEIGRVLRPGAGLGLIWNTRDETDELQRRITELIEPLRGDEQTHVGAGWRPVVESHPAFGAIEERHFPHEQVLDSDGLVERVRSVSFIAVQSHERQEEVLAQVRELAGGGPVRLPYLTKAFVTRLL
jgi:SAM-dependent methyltransferase